MNFEFEGTLFRQSRDRCPKCDEHMFIYNPMENFGNFLYTGVVLSKLRPAPLVTSCIKCNIGKQYYKKKYSENIQATHIQEGLLKKYMRVEKLREIQLL